MGLTSKTPATSIASAIGILCLGISVWAQNDRARAGTVGSSAILPSSVPYTNLDGMIVVKSTIGAGEPMDSVIATALPMSLITQELATKLSIQGSGIFEMPTLGGPARVQTCAPQQIMIGRVPISNVPLGIFDLYTHLSARPVQAAPSLWLGWTSLGALSLTIDPEKHEVIVNPNAAQPARKAEHIPFELVDGRIYVQAKLNGHKPIRMLVDTASMGSLIPADAARALRLTELASVPVRAAGGKESRVTVVKLNELALTGNLKIKDVRAMYVSSGDAPDLGPDTGLIGTEALLRHRVTFHYGRSTIAFEKIEPKKDVVQTPPQPMPPAKGTESPAGGDLPSPKPIVP